MKSYYPTSPKIKAIRVDVTTEREINELPNCSIRRDFGGTMVCYCKYKPGEMLIVHEGQYLCFQEHDVEFKYPFYYPPDRFGDDFMEDYTVPRIIPDVFPEDSITPEKE